MISERELESIREAQELFMPQRLIIRRKAYVGDAGFTGETVAIDVPGRLIPGFGRWSEVADRYTGITPIRVTVPWDQELEAGMTVVDEDGRTYEVRDVIAPSSYQTAKQALTDKIN
jgi:hypothetical protein